MGNLKDFHNKPKVYRKSGAQRMPYNPLDRLNDRVDYKLQARRVKNLNRLLRACEGDEALLADVLYLPVMRISDILAGNTIITDEMAMHIESQGMLPGGWLDSDDPVPESFSASIRGEDRAHDDVEHAEPEEVVESNSVAAQPEAPRGVLGDAESDTGVAALEAKVETHAPEQQRDIHRGRPFSVSIEVSEARRKNLIAYLDSAGKGSRSLLARDLNIGVAVVSAWLMGRRRITDNWAHKINAVRPMVDMLLDKAGAPCGSALIAEQPAAEPEPQGGQDQEALLPQKEIQPTTANDDSIPMTLKEVCRTLLEKQSNPVKIASAISALL